MLIYHPAYDAYHCVFRMLVITNTLRTVEFAKLRILDYYLCFPAEVSNANLPQEHVEIKKTAKSIKNDYRGPVSSSRAFRDMEPIQLAAARLLAASRILDPRQLELGEAVRTDVEVPGNLQECIDKAVEANQVVAAYILNQMSKIPLSGLGGLKQRTGLMEYRYDVT